MDAAVERHIERTAAGEEEMAEGNDEAEADDDGDDDDEEEEEEGEEDEDEEEVGAFEGGAGLMSGAALGAYVSAVLRADGPTVTTVLLKADGTKEQKVSSRASQRPLGQSREAAPLTPSLCCAAACCAVAGHDPEAGQRRGAAGLQEQLHRTVPLPAARPPPAPGPGQCAAAHQHSQGSCPLSRLLPSLALLPLPACALTSHPSLPVLRVSCPPPSTTRWCGAMCC